MERVSPTIHLAVRSCIFCTTLAAVLALLGAIRHKIPFRGRLLQTLALLFKLVRDLVPVILGALKKTSQDDGTIRLVESILLCCSYICTTSLEHLLLWNVTSNSGLGWVIHRPGVAITILINLSLFIPFIKWRNESYYFWTISGASCLHFSLFCFAHIWLTKHLQLSPQKWSRLAGGYLACLTVALSSLTSLFVGWKILRARDLFPEVGNEGNTEALRDFHATSDLQILPGRKALIIINVQNDSFFVKDDLYITNHDFVPRLKELIPYFRNDTDIFWVCTHMDHEATFYQEGTRGAEIYRDILDMVDETKDLIVIKHHHHSAFDQTSLLMSLRKMLILNVYLCGFLTNVGIYSTAADAVQHGLRVTVIEDCLGYRSEEKHKQAIGQMVEIMGVDTIASEGIMNEYGGQPVPDMEPLGIPLSELRLNTDENTTGDGKLESTAS